MQRKHIKVVYRKLGKDKVWGWANSHNNSIEIDERLKGKKHFEIMTHEAFHLLFPNNTEEQVIEKSIIFTNMVWKQGYRKVDNSNIIPLQDGKK